MSIEAAIVEHKMPAFAGYSKDIKMFVVGRNSMSIEAAIVEHEMPAFAGYSMNIKIID